MDVEIILVISFSDCPDTSAFVVKIINNNFNKKFNKFKLKNL